MSSLLSTASSTATEIYQLIYISRITSTGLSNASTLNDIAEVSILNNKTENLTGILCYGNGCFFQCLEGTEQALTNLKNRLLMDDRHKDLKIFDFSTIDERRFKSWSLRSITLERWMINDPNVKAFMPFKPYHWDSDEYQKFLDILQGYYEMQKESNETDTQPIKYNALGVTLGKVVGQHQVFLLIQAVLGLSIVVTLLWFLLSDKF